MLKIGEKAPDFELPDQDGKLHKLSTYIDKWVFIYFYPKDNTPGCTTEACSIRDSFEDFKKRGVVVFGVSADSTSSHKKFEEKQNLNFTLLSDPEKEMIKQYGAWGEKKMMGRTFDGIFRVSYLINPEGKIAKIYPKVDPKTHVKKVLSDLEKPVLTKSEE